MAKDELMSRVKDNYELRYKEYLPRRTYAVLRLDGKAFHTYTRGCERPFDLGLMDDMDSTAKYLCENMQGALFAYVQSDEISILLTDFKKIKTSAWFDYEIQKISSISASMAAAKFNQLRLKRIIEADSDENIGLKGNVLQALNDKLAAFDCRTFSVPDPVEVANVFIARQNDATKNAISMAAQAEFSHKSLHGLSGNEKQEKLFQEKGINFNDYPAGFRRGRFIERVVYDKDGATRSKWDVVESPIFTQEQGFLYSKIPVVTPNGVCSLKELGDATANLFLEPSINE